MQHSLGGPGGFQPGSMSRITDSKLASFAVGQQKKSRFQKAREDEEKKKRLEVEEAAKVYDEVRNQLSPFVSNRY